MIRTYPIKIPKIVQNSFSKYTWCFPTDKKKVYLTFDDGPIPIVTPWVLKSLSEYNAKATFFCIGENVEKHTPILRKIIAEGHAIGNHTQSHLNGWKSNTARYLADVCKATDTFKSLEKEVFKTNLFRPPYGRLTRNQGIEILARGFQIVMWDVLSGDFNQRTNPEKCLENVIKNVENGSIVVFHDSKKAFKNLKFVLPKVLEKLDNQGFSFCSIPNQGREINC